MSRFHDSLGHESSSRQPNMGKVVDGLSDYPELQSVLCGEPARDGRPSAPPSTLMLFIEGERLKFCLSPREGDLVAFGGPLDVSKLAESLEHCIAAGDYDWKRRKSRGGR